MAFAKQLLKPLGTKAGTAVNVMSVALPFVAGVALIPLLVHHLGIARFGLLALAWTIVGYFSLLDLGLSRAIVQLVGESLGRGRIDDLRKFVGTARVVIHLLSGVLFLVTLAFTPWLTSIVGSDQGVLEGEVIQVGIAIALTIPFTISNTFYRSVLEGFQLFLLTSGSKLFLGLANFVFPAVAVYIGGNVAAAVFSLLAARIITNIVLIRACRASIPAWRDIRYHREVMGRLLGFGGWVSISNFVSPIMQYIDRFFIASLGLAAVGYYTAPFDMVTKLLAVAVAISAAALPAIAKSWFIDRDRLVEVYTWSVKVTFVLFSPVIIIATMYSREILQLWLGVEFSTHSSTVLAVISIGVLFNAIAQGPFSLLLGIGKPSVVALLHLAEAPFFIAGSWLLITNYGIDGAAIAWSLRVTLDATILFYLAARETHSWQTEALISAMLVVALIAGGVAFDAALPVKHAVVACMMGILFGIIWMVLLSGGDRLIVITFVKRLKLDSRRSR